MRKLCKKSVLLYMGLAAAIVLVNMLAWNSTAFCDAYIQYIFPIWVNTYGRVTGIFSFSVGEILLVLGVCSVAATIILVLTNGVLQLYGFFRKRKTGKAEGCVSFSRLTRGYLRGFAWLLMAVCMIMTLNCTILYHGSTFSEQYYGKEKEYYTLEELQRVRNYVVERCNALALEMERDEQGTILYTENIGDKAVEVMQKLGETYDRLDGYYPNPKPLAASDFFSQQYMAGYYFPFSMEANYNDVMYIMNKPATMCHELAHLRGYIYEDEANFISYLACIRSGDKVFEYSGYLSVLYYLDNDFYDAVGADKDLYREQPAITKQVHEDNIFLTDEEWERINEKALIDTETVDEISDTFTETVLVANGVSDGMISYSRVVRLLLQYYENAGF